MGLINKKPEEYYLGPDGLWDSHDEEYGNYQFTTLDNIITNFIIAYVGEDKLISKIKRTDVAFHAKRGLQEFSFDLLPSVKSVEIEVGPSLGLVLPQDYVNYVKLSWVDQEGLERIIYPTRNTSDPRAIVQDAQYAYTFDEDGNLATAEDSETRKAWDGLKNPDMLLTYEYGRRYGLNPEEAQANGVFYIDQSSGIIRLSSNLAGMICTLKYISDGLGDDKDMIVHKFAEQAMYLYIAKEILSTRSNTQEYLINRFKRDFSAARRNAKIRLSNIKLGEILQTMRNQSKWIK